MPNPVFNEESFKAASQNQNGWAAPQAGTHVAPVPVTDGPVSSWQKAMTINGTISASAVLLLIVLATASVFGVMLLLYRTRIIKVTDKFRRVVIFATLGVMVLYLGSFIFSLF